MKKKYIAPKTKYASMMLSNIIAESIQSGEGEGSHDASSRMRNFFDDDEEDDEFNW